MKTNELTGAALDWAVTKAEGFDHEVTSGEWGMWGWATDWAQAGSIIEREGIGLDQHECYPTWTAFTPAPEQPSGLAVGVGQTPLIAAMRCYVASKLGDEVEIPEELK